MVFRDSVISLLRLSTWDVFDSLLPNRHPARSNLYVSPGGFNGNSDLTVYPEYCTLYCTVVHAIKMC